MATSPTPDLDRLIQRLSDTANSSKLWFGIVGALALVGGRRVAGSFAHRHPR